MREWLKTPDARAIRPNWPSWLWILPRAKVLIQCSPNCPLKTFARHLDGAALKAERLGRGSCLVSKEPRSRKAQPKPGGAATVAAAEPTDPSPAPPDLYASDFDFLLINGEMNETMFGTVMRAVSKYRRNKKLVLIVVTYGGVANPTYRTARYLQSVYDEIHAFVPSLCKSAGTLMVTAAHTLIVSPLGEMGPLDVQLMQKDEILGRRVRTHY
jgi:hypothetical protein